MVLHSRFTWITNSSDHRRVWNVNLLHTKQLPNPLGHKAWEVRRIRSTRIRYLTTVVADLIFHSLRLQEIRSSNPPVVTGICDPNKSRKRHHRNHTWIFEFNIQWIISHYHWFVLLFVCLFLISSSIMMWDTDVLNSGFFDRTKFI